MMTITEFCDRHHACADGRRWARASCKTMQEAWDKARPEWLIWIATRLGVLDGRTLRRFAVWSARRVQHLISDQRSVACLDVAERHADGLATDEELAAAREGALAAAGTTGGAAAAWDAAWAAAWAATRDAVGDAWDAGGDAWDAGGDAWIAAWDAARAAAGEAEAAAAGAATQAAAGAAAWATERAAQAAWLRANATPNWEAA